MSTSYPRTCLGIDPGTANIGFALVRKDSARAKPHLLALDYLGTKKWPGTVIADDVRRLRIAVKQAERWILRATHTTEFGMVSPDDVVIEWYAPRGRQRGGWKTALTVGAFVAVAELAGVPLVAASPKDRAAADRDKAKVIAAMKRRVVGFAEALERWPETKHEHLADACAHAVAALETT